MTALRAPFAYFGGKAQAVPIVWPRFGDPAAYVEPFAGSAAMLWGRPQFSGLRHEVIGDASGLVVNALRAIRERPEEVAALCDRPPAELDLQAMAAQLAVFRGTDNHLVVQLLGDPHYCDTELAAWWLLKQSWQLGAGLDRGPWVAEGGRLVYAPGTTRGISRQKGCLAHIGRGVHGDQIERYPGGLAGYLRRLSTRLVRVKILCGDWRRTLSPSLWQAATRGDASRLAIFLDPPYQADYEAAIYPGVDSLDVAAEVRRWCIHEAPTGARIALCGYDDEHDALLDHGWQKTPGHRISGYQVNPTAREFLWFSPAARPAMESLLPLEVE